MPAEVSEKNHIAVLGGGISGLTAAKKLAEAGYAVDVYEAATRLGGKIESRQLDGRTVNAGAEFIDSTQPGMTGLANQLGLKLMPATDQSSVLFRLPDGKVIDNDRFLAAARP